MDFSSNSPYDENNPITFIEYPVRVVMIGDTKVGKTSLVLKYFRNSFSDDVQPTIGSSVFTRVYTEDDKKIVINYYDTAGQETYRSLGRLYYRNCICAILVFDVTDRDSFDNLESWVEEFRSHCESKVVYIAANKSDIKDKQVVTLDEAIEKAKQLECECMLTSAADGTGVTELFHTVNSEIIQTMRKKWMLRDNVNVMLQEKDQSSRGCC